MTYANHPLPMQQVQVTVEVEPLLVYSVYYHVGSHMDLDYGYSDSMFIVDFRGNPQPVTFGLSLYTRNEWVVFYCTIILFAHNQMT